MVHLTPIEETVIGRELIALGEERGIKLGEKLGEKRGEKRGIKLGEKRGEKRGEERGMLIGQIALCRRLLGLPEEPTTTFQQQSLSALRKSLETLQAQLGIR